MAKSVIVSEDTLRDLLEANASLAAWYYELSAALRAANAVASTPDEAKRAAFLGRVAADFPEVAHVARAISAPRLYVPPPPAVAAPARAPLEAATLVEPATARSRIPDGEP